MKFLLRVRILVLLMGILCMHFADAQDVTKNDLYELKTTDPSGNANVLRPANENYFCLNVVNNNIKSLAVTDNTVGTVTLTVLSDKKLYSLTSNNGLAEGLKAVGIVAKPRTSDAEKGYEFDITLTFTKKANEVFKYSKILTFNYYLLSCPATATEKLKLSLTSTVPAADITLGSDIYLPIQQFISGNMQFTNNVPEITPCTDQLHGYTYSSYYTFAWCQNSITGLTNSYTLSGFNPNANYSFFYLTRVVPANNAVPQDITSLTFTSTAVDPYQLPARVPIPGCTLSKVLSPPFINTPCASGTNLDMVLSINYPMPYYNGSCKPGSGNVTLYGEDWIGQTLTYTAPAGVKFLNPSTGLYESSTLIIANLSSSSPLGFSYKIEPGFDKTLAASVIKATLKKANAAPGDLPTQEETSSPIYSNTPALPLAAHSISLNTQTLYNNNAEITMNTQTAVQVVGFKCIDGVVNTIKYYFTNDAAHNIKTLTPPHNVQPLFYYGTQNPTFSQFKSLQALKAQFSSDVILNAALSGASFSDKFDQSENSFTITGLALPSDCDKYLYVLFENCTPNPALLNSVYYNDGGNTSSYIYSGYYGYFKVLKPNSIFPLSKVFCSTASQLSLIESSSNNSGSASFEASQEYYQVYELSNTSGATFTSFNLIENIQVGNLSSNGNDKVIALITVDGVPVLPGTNGYQNSSTVDNTYNITGITVLPGKTFRIFFKRVFTGLLKIEANVSTGAFSPQTTQTTYNVSPVNTCCNFTQFPLVITPDLTNKVTCGSTVTVKASLPIFGGITVPVTWQSPAGTQISNTGTFVINNMQTSNAGIYIATMNPFGTCFLPKEVNITTYCEPPYNCVECIPSFSPVPGNKYLVSGWVKKNYVGKAPDTYTDAGLNIYFKTASGETVENLILPSGPIIDGWQRIEAAFDIPLEAMNIVVELVNEDASMDAFFDDIRVHPFKSNMKSFVYDPSSQKLIAELDENNYATKYEYDDEGILIRVKKETERGVMTIKETRNNQSKLK